MNPKDREEIRQIVCEVIDEFFPAQLRAELEKYLHNANRKDQEARLTQAALQGYIAGLE